jgi:hypothetical protein
MPAAPISIPGAAALAAGLGPIFLVGRVAARGGR